jgi:cell division protein FtsW (lipid II flippase)
MTTFAMQVAGYVSFNLGIQALLVPFSLPLISHGRTATMTNLVLIGFMLSVFRTGGAVTDARVRRTERQTAVMRQ